LLYREVPVGYLQTYRIADHPEYARALQIEADAAGVDLFIGEAEYLYRGLGPAALRKFLKEVIFADPEISCCVLGPQPENRSAIRAYEKVGFRYVKTVRVPGQEEPEYLMRVLRHRSQVKPVCLVKSGEEWCSYGACLLLLVLARRDGAPSGTRGPFNTTAPSGSIACRSLPK